MSTQRLLWHSVVEPDAPALLVRITGLAPHAVLVACGQARSALRQARTDLYLARLELQDCDEAIRRLALRSEAPPVKELTGHLRTCPACVSVYKDLVRLDRHLEAQLPVRLLGWWTGERYLLARAAIPVPLGEAPLRRGFWSVPGPMSPCGLLMPPQRLRVSWSARAWAAACFC
ncbi:hypothetical protein [Streptomyces coffeae]|uniref:Zinc-finger domain-containing protein n=1 Tax=Streptomyces coffeae TaxID=621382 RepID=A0ABS1NPX5_9ACTN|nr:hypothetical protein [Streptomyces coffeae]MBL1102123.1 hypothetical protein [Streptomyces coffeae]